MYTDPIVTEVRQAGQRLAEQAGGDVHTFFQRLRDAQQHYHGRVVHAPRHVAYAIGSSLQQDQASQT